MKKVFILVLLLSTFCFFSCKDDEKSKNVLLGKWKLISQTWDGVIEDVSDKCEGKTYFEFKEKDFIFIDYNHYEDGECRSYVFEGFYVTSDNKLILSYDDESVNMEYSLSGDKLTLTSKSDGILYITVYKKQ